jgi:hypothetical protein
LRSQEGISPTTENPDRCKGSTNLLPHRHFVTIASAATTAVFSVVFGLRVTTFRTHGFRDGSVIFVAVGIIGVSFASPTHAYYLNACRGRCDAVWS